MRRTGVVVVTTVGVVGTAGAVAAGVGAGAVGVPEAGGSAAQTVTLRPQTPAKLHSNFVMTLPPETDSCFL